MTEHPRGLMLGIRETIEVECERCQGTGYIVAIPASFPEDYVPDVKEDGRTCPRCHGSGKRTVQLVGLVAVKPAIVYASCCCDTDDAGIELILPPKKQFKGRKKLTGAMYPESLTNVIIDAYQAGTLPDELLYSETNENGLRTIEVTT